MLLSREQKLCSYKHYTAAGEIIHFQSFNKTLLHAYLRLNHTGKEHHQNTTYLYTNGNHIKLKIIINKEEIKSKSIKR